MLVQVLLLSAGTLIRIPHLWRSLWIRSQSCSYGTRRLQRSRIISRLSDVGLSRLLVRSFNSFNPFQQQQHIWCYTTFSFAQSGSGKAFIAQTLASLRSVLVKAVQVDPKVHPVIGQLKEHYFVVLVALGPLSTSLTTPGLVYHVSVKSTAPAVGG